MTTKDTGGTQNLRKSWLERFITNRKLMSHVVGKIVHPDEVEDILQETFLNSYAAARKDKIQNPRAFMVKVARNLALNHIKRSDVRLNSSLDDYDESDLHMESKSTEDQVHSNEMFLVFCRAVTSLPLACRRVFILRKVYGQSQLEVAKYLKISQSTVEKHVAKGMFLTAKYMMERGHLEEYSKVSLTGMSTTGQVNE
tara:strand:- start:121799 stop:122392 length:594 start_codon:yes stop_codon:yes gene_type:complete